MVKISLLPYHGKTSLLQPFCSEEVIGGRYREKHCDEQYLFYSVSDIVQTDIDSRIPVEEI
jgi:hypothetical protein